MCHLLSLRRLMTVAFTILGSSVSSADIVRVDINAPPGGDGTGWAVAHDDLQAALGVAVAGDQIWVASGTYTPAGPGGDRSIAIQLVSGVEVYGGFAGTEALLEERDIIANETILSGDLNHDDTGDLDDPSRAENSTSVVNGTGTDAATLLDGFTVMAGNANGGAKDTTEDRNGGGLFMQDAFLTLRNLTVNGNHCNSSGGGALVWGGAVVVEDCSFSFNRCGGNGGGLSGFDATFHAVRCSFVANRGGIGGDGVSCGNGSALFEDCLIANNLNVFSNASAVFSWNSSVEMHRSRVHGHHDAGIVVQNDDVLPLTLVNSVIDANAFGIEATMVDLTLTSCTVANSLDAVVSLTFESSNLIENSVFFGNVADVVAGSEFSPNTTINFTNYQPFLQAVFLGVGDTNMDPKFVDLNGPDNILGTLDDDLRLAANSPLIGAGSNALIPPGGTTDFNGDARVVGGVVDMGAFENQALDCPFDVSPSPLGDSIVGIQDFLAVLSQWGDCPVGCTADGDNDGVVGVVDFLGILMNWGGCP